MLKALGNKVIIKPKELETKTESGIVISYGSDEKRHKIATMEGTVFNVGPLAWKDWGDEPWAKVGDKVIFAQYAGKMVVDPATKEEFFVINDEDVQVKIED